MKSIIQRITAAAAILSALCVSGFAMEVFNTEKKPVIEKASLNVDGRLQLFGHGEVLKDPVRNDGRLYLFLKQARLRVHGNVNDVKYETQLVFAGEDAVQSGQNASFNLLDFDFDVPFFGGTFLKVGQFRVPYGRELLVDEGEMLFADRSINNLAFRVGRDVGGAVYSQNGPFKGIAGVFTGGGRDVPERYLPEKIGLPLLAVRAGYDTGTDEDLFNLNPANRGAGKRFAVYGNALWIQDTLIGHSLVLNIKTTEKPLLMDPGWNPFAARAPLDRGSMAQAGGDVLWQFPVGGTAVSLEAEGDYSMFKNVYGRLELAGGRVQATASKGAVDVAARYSYLVLDPAMRSATNTANPVSRAIVTGRKPIQEIVPSITYHLKKGHSKIVFDLPILVGTPVVIENNVGTYVLVPQQPGQTATSNAIRTITRRTVVQGQMLYQLSF